MSDNNRPDKNKTNDAIVSFDTIYTTNSIQLLKLSLPLFHHDMQPLIATLIKARELSYCYELLQHTKIHSFSICDDKIDQFLSCAKSYCNQEQLTLFQTLQQLRKTLRILEKMQQLNISLPFDESADLSQLLLILPQIFQSAEESPQSEQPLKASASDGQENNAKANTPDNDAGVTSKHTAKAPDSSPLKAMLSNTLSPHQKELYEKYMEMFSKNEGVSP